MFWPLTFGFFTTYRARIFWSLIPGIVIFFLLLGLIGLYQQKQLVEEEFIKRGRGLAASLARGSQLGIYSENKEILKASLQGVFTDPDVAYVVIYGDNGKILDVEATMELKSRARTWKLSDNEKRRLFIGRQTFSNIVKSDSGSSLEFFAPVITNEPNISEDFRLGLFPAPWPEPQVIGAVRVGLSLQVADAHIASLLRWQGALIAAFLILITLVIYAIARGISKPIRSLTEQSNNIANGFLDQTIPVESYDEIGQLASSFNNMARSLREKIAEKETVVKQLKELNQTLEERVSQRTAEIKTINARLVDANRHKSQFLANVNHELRTPVSAIIGYARLVLRETEGQVSQLQKENLQDLLNNAEHLLDMINSLLDLAKIEAGRMEIRVEPVNIHNVITGGLSAVAPMLKHDRVRVIREIASDLPVLSTDPDKLRRILLNLVANAAKFTEQGEIRISAFRQNGSLRLAVSDTGIGIENGDLEHIFEEFRQGDQSTARKYAGTGLGLAIVKRLVDLLGGEIGVESEVGRGSTFTVTLPVDSSPSSRTGEKPGTGSGER